MSRVCGMGEWEGMWEWGCLARGISMECSNASCVCLFCFSTKEGKISFFLNKKRKEEMK